MKVLLAGNTGYVTEEFVEIYYGRWKNRAAFGPFAFGRTGNKKLEEVEKCQKK